METLIYFCETYGLWVVFAAALLDQGGLPLPAYPVIVVTSALAAASGGDLWAIWAILLVAIVAVLIADVVWFYGGRHFGGPLLRLMCRVSLSPDSCVSLTRRVYMRWGAPSLTVAKYVPGFAAVATTLAGESGISLRKFVLFDAIGAAAWAGGAVLLGFLFHDAVAAVLAELERLGYYASALLLAVVLGYVLAKWWRRQRFIAQVRMARMSVQELAERMQSGSPPTIVDVRLAEQRARSGWIPGSIHAPFPVEPVADREREIVVYCDCPNDASAAIVAKALREKGFVHVRPLRGGIDAWRAHGLPVETSLRTGRATS